MRYCREPELNGPVRCRATKRRTTSATSHLVSAAAAWCASTPRYRELTGNGLVSQVSGLLTQPAGMRSVSGLTAGRPADWQAGGS